MCEFAARCKSESTHAIIHKVFGKRPAFTRNACVKCASMIGKGLPQGPLINTPTMDSVNYRIVKL